MPEIPSAVMTPDELKAILSALGWSQPEAGRRAGLTREHVNALANGRIKIKGAVAAFFRCASKHGGDT